MSPSDARFLNLWLALDEVRSRAIRMCDVRNAKSSSHSENPTLD